MPRAQVVHDAEVVAADRIALQEGAHSESDSLVIPAGVKPACPGSLRDEFMKQMDRIPGIHPIEDPAVGHRFREKLSAAFAAAAAGVILTPGRDVGPYGFNIQHIEDVVIGVKEGSQVIPCPGRVKPSDPPPGDPWKPPWSAHTSEREVAGKRRLQSLHWIIPLRKHVVHGLDQTAFGEGLVIEALKTGGLADGSINVDGTVGRLRTCNVKLLTAC